MWVILLVNIIKTQTWGISSAIKIYIHYNIIQSYRIVLIYLHRIIKINNYLILLTNIAYKS